MDLKEMHVTPKDMTEADMRLRDQEVEIERLRAALTEIAEHYIDSELASREKRGMAIRALVPL